MGREKHVSNGECALYGAVRFDDHKTQENWRHRISNERTGHPIKDDTGNNAAVSLMWNADYANGHQDASQVRLSQLKMVQDMGMKSTVPPGPTAGDSRPSPSPRYRGSIPVPQAPAAPSGRVSEKERLELAAHERSLGQTFLNLGNLQRAKKHFRAAEELMKTETPR